MATKQEMIGHLKNGNYVIFNNVPCKIIDIQTSKPGKHGHMKCRVTAESLIDGRKIIEMMPGHDKVEVPIVEKRNAQVLSVHGDSANVMDMENYETFDIKIPEEFAGQVKVGGEIFYWIMLGDKVIKQVK